MPKGKAKPTTLSDVEDLRDAFQRELLDGASVLEALMELCRPVIVQAACQTRGAS